MNKDVEAKRRSTDLAVVAALVVGTPLVILTLFVPALRWVYLAPALIAVCSLYSLKRYAAAALLVLLLVPCALVVAGLPPMAMN